LTNYYESTPYYAAVYLEELLKNNGLYQSQDERIARVRELIDQLRQNADEQSEEAELLDEAQKKDTTEALHQASREIQFRKRIEEYYLPKQLVDAILETGRIPEGTQEHLVGVGFIDIADYTFLSKFLSPNENQTVLNGLYAAFNHVLKRHGGYLNKIEGDSIMFHFGGPIDPNVRGLERKDEERYIARELFYTCVEMQRVAFLFNQANDRFLYDEDKTTHDAVKNAFEIISSMRTSNELSQAINAYFQIRIRIGANLGEATMGNFGPEGAKQWDIIGVPVIRAKRMESTAPIGGFRISEEFYNILEENGIVEEYYRRFKREAEALFGSFKDIGMEELFKFGKVLLKDKRNAMLNSYSIQVNPGLPEALMNQVDSLMNKGEEGASRIIEMLKYYRGNRFVIDGLESTFKRRGVHLRKADILNLLSPRHYRKVVERNDNDQQEAVRAIQSEYSLYNLFELLGKLQDTVKQDVVQERPSFTFTSYEQYTQSLIQWMDYEIKQREKRVYQRTYFFDYIFPLLFHSIKASILETQQHASEVTEVLENDAS
jgi:class 3 adenylate cyclase